MTDQHRALVIGAGLAGCSTALALARCGYRVEILAAPGRSASDVPAAVLAPPLLPADDILTTFRYRAAAFAQAWYGRLDAHTGDGGRLGNGVLLLPKRERDHDRFAQLPLQGPGPVRVSAAMASAMCGAQLDVTCAHHPGGGWFDPALLRRAMLACAPIEPLPATVVASVRRHGGEWVARDAAGTALAAAPTCIIAAGMASTRLVSALQSYLLPARGQVTAVSGKPLHMAVSGNGYAVPDAAGRTWLGATINRGDTDVAVRDDDHENNRSLYRRLHPSTPVPDVTAAFVAVRATTRDRLPLAGHLGDGLWVNTGHGTQGLTTTPITARLLAGAINRSTVHPLLARLHPARPAARYRETTVAPLP